MANADVKVSTIALPVLCTGELKTYVVGAGELADSILMSTHSIGFYVGAH